MSSLAVSAGAGQKDGGTGGDRREDEIFMRCSCWREAGLQSSKEGSSPANSSLTTTQRPDRAGYETLTALAYSLIKANSTPTAKH